MKSGWLTSEALGTLAVMGVAFVMAVGGLHWGHSLAMAVASGSYCVSRAMAKKGGGA